MAPGCCRCGRVAPSPGRSRPGAGPARRHVLLFGVGAGEEAVGAEQLAAERADAVAVAHPSPQARRAHRLRLAPGAPQRWARSGPVALPGSSPHPPHLHVHLHAGPPPVRLPGAGGVRLRPEATLPGPGTRGESKRGGLEGGQKLFVLSHRTIGLEEALKFICFLPPAVGKDATC